MVDRMPGNAESMRVLYGWLEIQIWARLADATQSLVQTPSCSKSCGFFDTVRHQFEKKRFTAQNTKLITVFWQKT
jgi:hypothetical protein